MNSLWTTPRSVLLTGATGYLGGWVCAELLKSSPATIYCLVRAADEAAANTRLAARLAEIGAVAQPWRMISVAGDLAAPDMGLRPSDYDALAETVDAVVHCAAEPEAGSAANIDGILALIALAERRRTLAGTPPRLTVVSSLGAIAGAGPGPISEETAGSPATTGRLDWSRRSASAEAELREASARGLPVTIIRAGAVTGDSSTGRTGKADSLARLLQALTALGTVPSGRVVIPAEMADVAASAVVALVRSGPLTGQTCHLLRAEPPTMSAVAGALQRAGYRVEETPPDQWLRQIESYSDRQPPDARVEAALYLTAEGTPQQFASGRAWAALGESVPASAPWDDDYLDRLVAGLVSDGTLSAPGTPAPARTAPVTAPPADARNGSIRVDGVVAPWTTANWFETPDAAVACEQQGYGGFWLPEEKHDPMLALARAADRTSSLQLGTAVSIALARTPMTLAYTTHDLQVISKGRLMLGLGTQVGANLPHRFSMPGDRPRARMREFVSALRAIWRCWDEGEPLDFRGEFYRHTLMQPKFTPPPSPYGPPPVLLATIGPRMAELAGEVADGLIAPPFATAKHVSEMLMPAAERGLAKAGRDRSDFTVVCIPPVITGDAPAERQAGRHRVADLVAKSLGVAAYRPLFELEEMAWLNDELVTLSLSDDPDRWSRMTDLVDEKFLDLVVVDSPADQVGNRLRERLGGIADRMIIPAPFGALAREWDPVSLRLRDADPCLPQPDSPHGACR